MVAGLAVRREDRCFEVQNPGNSFVATATVERDFLFTYKRLGRQDTVKTSFVAGVHGTAGAVSPPLLFQAGDG